MDSDGSVLPQGLLFFCVAKRACGVMCAFKGRSNYLRIQIVLEVAGPAKVIERGVRHIIRIKTSFFRLRIFFT